MMKCRAIVPLVTVGVLLSISRIQTEGTSYSVMDLGVVGTSTRSAATAINELGDVAGDLSGGSPPSGAFLYSGGSTIALPAFQEANGINIRRNVVGRALFGGESHGALYSGGTTIDLGVLPGGQSSAASAINVRNQVVGQSASSAGIRPALFSNGSVVELPAPVSSQSVASANASGINDNSQIAGVVTLSGSASVARGYLLAGGVPVDLGSLAWGSLFSQGVTIPAAVNNVGDIVGSSVQWNGTAAAQDHAFLFRQGRLIDLGTLGFDSAGNNTSTANGINNAGQIVGQTTVSGTSVPHAFVYANGVMTDLNALGSVPSGWTLTNAAAINDSGYIAATMSNSQTFASHACLLVPTATVAPAITRSPSDQAVATGSTVTLIAIATGTPIPAYQWQTSNDGTSWTTLSDTAPYSGTTTPVLTISPADATLNGRKFRVTASNSTGVASSAAATLTVQSAATAPIILSGPSDVSAAAGGTATLSAQVTGTEPLTYSWQRDGSPIAGASGSQLVISDVQRTHAASYTVTVSNSAGSLTSAPARISVLGASPDSLLFGAIKSGTTVTATPAQAVAVWYAGSGAPQWTVTGDQPWISVNGGSGGGSGVFSVGISNPGDVIGNNTALNGSVTISAAALGINVVIPVRLTVSQGTTGAVPFGAFDTPVDNSAGLQGSIAVTGWALDDVGVDHVEIWRDQVAGETTPVFNGAGPGNGKIYIGNAFFVSGARPDVQAAFASYPLGQRAGWGYLLLTWGLWQQGNGPYTLYAFAFDVDGHAATLGSKHITVDNAHANKPFGTIDTPAYGGAASGISWNYGWALTPGQTCTVGGGTVQASIDSGPLVPVTYGDRRSDIASSFAGFTDASAAGGHYLLDTTNLADGVHQIGWLVTDSCGRADGIGSRFFNVANGGSGALTASDSRITRTSVDHRLRVLRNDVVYSPALSTTGVAVVPLEQGQRVEVQLPSDAGPYDGVLLAGGVRGPLPLGSSFDQHGGRFYWQPAPGFLGAYDLVFTASAHAVAVRIAVGPPLRMTVDSPSAGALLSNRFTVSGWALDLSAAERGIDVVHVWAYPVGGGSPLFAGWASVENQRPDVASLYGPTFASSGYTVDASLPAGTYDLVVFAHLVNANAFVANTPVRIVVR